MVEFALLFHVPTRFAGRAPAAVAWACACRMATPESSSAAIRDTIAVRVMCGINECVRAAVSESERMGVLRGWCGGWLLGRTFGEAADVASRRLLAWNRPGSAATCRSSTPSTDIFARTCSGIFSLFRL
jgi:hypothetical protein